MTVRCESRITVASSVTDVWAYICDVGRWPEWAPTVHAAWISGGAPLQPGSKVEQRAKLMFGFTRYRAQKVTAVDAPRRVAFAGPMGTSAARWGMEFEPMEGTQTEAMMWVEVDLQNIMRRIPGRALRGRIQPVMDREMAAIKAALESATPGGSGPQTVSDLDGTREHLIGIYRKKAKHYDITSRFYPVPGYPHRAHRLGAVQALGLHPGDTVVEIACGTGLNFSLLEQAVGPDGRIVGVDLTDAMLAQAEDRIKTNGWSNVRLVQADAAEFEFPPEVDAILSTYALSQVPECGDVIAHGAAALARGGRWVVLDLKLPDNAPRWLVQLGIPLVRPFGSIDEWITRRPWDAIRAAMQDMLADVSWTELSVGTAFLAQGVSRDGRLETTPPRAQQRPGDRRPGS